MKTMLNGFYSDGKNRSFARQGPASVAGFLATCATCVMMLFGQNVRAQSTIVFQQNLTPSGSFTVPVGTLDSGHVNSTSPSGLTMGHLVGGVDSIERALLSYNLTASGGVPAGATITSVSLSLVFRAPTEETGTLGSQVFEAHALTSGFDANTVTWNNANFTTPWLTAGGDFSATVLSSASFDPITASAGAVMTFSSASNFVSAAQAALDGTGVLNILLKSNDEAVRDSIPQFYANFLVGGSDTNQPYLTVTYSAVPESSTYATLMGVLTLGGVCCARRKGISLKQGKV